MKAPLAPAKTGKELARKATSKNQRKSLGLDRERLTWKQFAAERVRSFERGGGFGAARSCCRLEGYSSSRIRGGNGDRGNTTQRSFVSVDLVETRGPSDRSLLNLTDKELEPSGESK